MNGADRQSRGFFEARYQASADPWYFASSPYELQRYEVTLAALQRATYRRAFEPGCSVGVLTAALARRCRQVVAWDIAAAAVSLARARCQDLPHVQIVRGDVAEAVPSGSFDLMILSELGYYFTAPQWRRVALALARRLEPGGELIAVHWLGDSSDHVLHGDQVHAVLRAWLPFQWTGGSRHPGFRLDSWRRPA